MIHSFESFLDNDLEFLIAFFPNTQLHYPQSQIFQTQISQFEEEVLVKLAKQ